MTNTQHTEESVLAHHGIRVGGTVTNLIDAARDAGLIYACLGCGSVGGIDVTADPFPAISVEMARVNTREAMDPDYFCCPDANQIVY